MDIKKSPTSKLVCGVGINDAGYTVRERKTVRYMNGKQRRKTVWFCPFYQAWDGMLKRCYSSKTQERSPTYRGCTVSEDWLTFSIFKAWMEKQDFEGKHLDKDLLIEGNKVYSAKTCVFVSPLVNNFTLDCNAIRGEWLVGVNWDKGTSKFKSRCSNPFTKKREHLGLFNCEQEAHNAWLKRKLELAYKLAAVQTDSRVAEALINRYSEYR